jgi:hypothetical protein
MKNNFLFLFLGIFLVLSLFPFVSSEEGCCVKLNDGSICRYVDVSECASDFSPTACEGYNPCILGTCVDTNKGECMPNTPAQICTEEGGSWDSRTIDEIPACQLGCCLIGDQAAFNVWIADRGKSFYKKLLKEAKKNKNKKQKDCTLDFTFGN